MEGYWLLNVAAALTEKRQKTGKFPAPQTADKLNHCTTF